MTTSGSLNQSSYSVPVGDTRGGRNGGQIGLDDPVHLFTQFVFSVPLCLCGKPSSLTFQQED